MSKLRIAYPTRAHGSPLPGFWWEPCCPSVQFSVLCFWWTRVAHLCSFLCCGFLWVRVAHLLSFLCCVFVLFVFILYLVYSIFPVSLACPFLITSSLFSYIYLFMKCRDECCIFFFFNRLADKHVLSCFSMLDNKLYIVSSSTYILRYSNHYVVFCFVFNYSSFLRRNQISKNKCIIKQNRRRSQ